MRIKYCHSPGWPLSKDTVACQANAVRASSRVCSVEMELACDQAFGRAGN